MKRFALVLRMVLLIVIAMGALLLILPEWVQGLLGLEYQISAAWQRVIGAGLLLVAFVLYPATVLPQRYLLMTIQSWLGLYCLALVFLVAGGPSFWIYAVVLLLTGLLLNIVWWSDYRTQLMAKP